MAILRRSSVAAFAAVLLCGIAVGVAARETIHVVGMRKAKALLSDAKAAAARWQSDAVLVSVTALQVADDGTAPSSLAGWVYTFHSAAAKKWAGFHAGLQPADASTRVGPDAMERVDVPAGFTQALPGSFVDSDAVLAEVRKHGFTKSGDTMLYLGPTPLDRSLKPGIYWCAASAADISVETGMRGYCVDPGTGRFVARMTGPEAAAPARPPSSEGGVLAGLDPARCGGFSTADAAAILGVHASGVTERTEQVRSNLWRCSFSSAGGPRVVFSIEVAKSAPEAAAEVEKYRASLKDNYSDLMGLGDEGVWTEVDRTVTFRKKNVTIRVQQPPEKIPQIKVVKILLGKI